MISKFLCVLCILFSTVTNSSAADAELVVETQLRTFAVNPATQSRDTASEPSWFAVQASQYILRANKMLTEAEAYVMADRIHTIARMFDIDPRLFLALVKIESRFNESASSMHGAKGLAQIMPKYHRDKLSTARNLFQATSVYDPRVNLYVGAWILKDHLTSSQSQSAALLRYNGSYGTGSTYARSVLQELANVNSRIKL
jgi:soluble lytic murein transglycosylase-like protein